MPLELQMREENTNIQDADAAGLQLQQCASQVGPAAAAGEKSTGTINKKCRTRKELLDEFAVRTLKRNAQSQPAWTPYFFQDDVARFALDRTTVSIK